jgi:hypothetical protein
MNSLCNVKKDGFIVPLFYFIPIIICLFVYNGVFDFACRFCMLENFYVSLLEQGLHLLNRCSFTSAMPPVPFAFGYLLDRVLCFCQGLVIFLLPMPPK